MASQEKLICSYPGPSIEVPNSIFDNEDFLSELVNFLIRMNEDSLPGAVATISEKKVPILAKSRTRLTRVISLNCSPAS